MIDWKLGSCSALLGLMMFAGGCGGVDELDAEDTEVTEASDALTRGQLLPANAGAPDTSAVSLLVPDGNKQRRVCSGIKIGDKRFLTAHHCGFQAWLGQTIYVTANLNGKSGTPVTLNKVHSHPTTLNILSDGIRQDFQILEVAQNTAIDSYSVYRKSRVGQNVGGWITSYGCDYATPSNEGFKQYGYLVTGYDQRPGYDETFMFVPQDTSNAAICYGDSGGPFFIKRNNVWEIAGIVSGAVEIGRISSVYAWIQSPKYNNLVASQKGFLLHKASNRALGMGSAHMAAVPVTQLWDGRDHATGVDKQYWQLFAGSAAGSFVIKSTASGGCLQANSNGSMSQVTCTSAADQSWKFENQSGGFNQVRNVQRNTCLQVLSSAGKTELRNVACNIYTDEQRWVFSN